MVPPCVGSGCAKTTAARGVPDGASSSTSKGPTGPAISRTTSDNASFLLCSGRRRDEGHHDGGKVARARDQTQMAGPTDGRMPGVRPEPQVLERQARRNDPIEAILTRDDQS